MKNNYLFSRFFLLVLFSLFIFTAKAQILISQNKKFSPYWEININGGASLFLNDITANSLFSLNGNNNVWRLGGGLMAGYQFTPVFGLRGQALYGQLAGINTRLNRYFQGDYIEFNLNTTINLNNLFGEKRSDRFASAYLLVGVGLTNYNSSFYDLTTGIKTGYIGFGYGSGIKGRTLEGILTGGVGVNFRINKKFDVNFESAGRVMNSNRMAGWTHRFKYDVYNYTSVGLTYRFGARRVRSVPATPVYVHKNVVQEAPGKTNGLNKKKPCVVEMQPVMPPATAGKVKQSVPSTQPLRSEIPVRQQKITKISPPRPVIEYRVQIRARKGHPISIAYLSRKYGIPQSDIREDKHNGYYIYTVGSYDTYGQARARRDLLRSHNGISDAFVVAFKNGYRLDKLP